MIGLSALMLIQALILFLMNDKLESEAVNISSQQVPSLKISQEMTIKVQELKSSLVLYVLGDKSKKATFDNDIKELNILFKELESIDPNYQNKDGIRKKIDLLEQSAMESIFGIFDPDKDSEFKDKTFQIIEGPIKEAKELLQNLESIKSSKVKLLTEEVDDELGDLSSDLEQFYYGIKSSKDNFNKDYKELKTFSNKFLSQGQIDEESKKLLKELIINITEQSNFIFSEFDPKPRLNTISNINELDAEINQPLLNQIKEISDYNSVLVGESVESLQKQISISLFTQSFAFSFGIVVVLFVTYFTYKKISKPISELNWMLYEIAGNNVFEDVKYLERKDEIGKMARAIQKLKDITTARNLAEIEIFQAKKVIEEKGIELEVMNEDLVAQREEIFSAIRYAKRIQNALLPTRVALSDIIDDFFLIYKPKDIVSGDFYWVHQKDDQKFIVVADCTGHGVPGSMLTMMGIMLMEEAILQFGLEKPNLILSYVNNKMRYRLTQYDEAKHIYDGMDVAFIVVHKDNTIDFSGAARPLFLIREGKLERVRGDKYSIGARKIGGDYIFSSTSIKVNPGDKIILSSDGFVDQVGSNGRKFGTKKLRLLLEDNHDKSSSELEKLLIDKLKEHMGSEEQRDDVALLGIKF